MGKTYFQRVRAVPSSRLTEETASLKPFYKLSITPKNNLVQGKGITVWDEADLGAKKGQTHGILPFEALDFGIVSCSKHRCRHRNASWATGTGAATCIGGRTGRFDELSRDG